MTINVVPRLERKGEGRSDGRDAGRMNWTMYRQPGPTPIDQFRDILGLMGHTVYACLHSKETGVGARSLSGPGGHRWRIGGMKSFTAACARTWYAVLLNINLAVINLLPLPLLDGGHIVLSRAGSRSAQTAQCAPAPDATSMAFAVLLITFMLYVTFFDIQRLTFGRFRGGSGSSTNEPASTPRHQPPMNYCANPFFWQRRLTREVKVGRVGVGGDNPIRVQTMLISRHDEHRGVRARRRCRSSKPAARSCASPRRASTTPRT